MGKLHWKLAPHFLWQFEKNVKTILLRFEHKFFHNFSFNNNSAEANVIIPDSIRYIFLLSTVKNYMSRIVKFSKLPETPLLLDVYRTMDSFGLFF